jgi:ABC-type oligopeptide transport system substrate-binding subunit
MSPGTVLAEKQLLVRHIKDEPASLDPAKAVGLPEIQVIRDLFEGLVNQDAKGNLIPAWRPAGRAMITASGRLPCAITRAGPTARRSPRGFCL